MRAEILAAGDADVRPPHEGRCMKAMISAADDSRARPLPMKDLA
jgi:hypothetical protein